MNIRDLKKRILCKIQYIINQRKREMLPRKNGVLDTSVIHHIVLLTGRNGKFVAVLAETDNGYIYEPYSPELYQLIINSGVSHTIRSLYEPPSDDNDEGDSNQPKLK